MSVNFLFISVQVEKISHDLDDSWSLGALLHDLEKYKSLPIVTVPTKVLLYRVFLYQIRVCRTPHDNARFTTIWTQKPTIWMVGHRVVKCLSTLITTKYHDLENIKSLPIVSVPMKLIHYREFLYQTCVCRASPHDHAR